MTFLDIKGKYITDVSEFVEYLSQTQSEGKSLGTIQLIPTVSTHRSFDQFIESIHEYGFQ